MLASATRYLDSGWRQSAVLAGAGGRRLEADQPMMLATRRGLSFPRARVQRRPQIPRDSSWCSVSRSYTTRSSMRVAEIYGWRWYHHPRLAQVLPRAGLDLVLVRGDRATDFRRVERRERGRQLTVDQKRGIAELQARCPTETYCVVAVRPAAESLPFCRRRMRDR